MAHSGAGTGPDKPIDDDFLDYTVEVFQPHTQRRITREDAREIHHNLTGFFGILLEWRRARDAQAESQAGAGT